MKQIFLTTSLTLLISMFGFTSNVEAAGCSSHKNKNVQVDECSLTDDSCVNLKSDKKLKKVDA